MTRRGWVLHAVALGVLATGVAACADDAAVDDAGPTSATGAPQDTEDTEVTEGPQVTEAPEEGTDAPSAASSAGSLPGSGRRPEGFSTIRAEITDADGTQCEVCLWLADDAAERGRGLMEVTDLGDAVGMAFRFEEATRGSFYMFQTPTPLSIAWFSPDGDHVGTADMEPCLDTPAGDCPLYSPDSPYVLAIEVFRGDLDDLGLGPGSRVELIAGSEAERCAASG